MTTSTLVTWHAADPNSTDGTAIWNQAALMQSEGKTDNEKVRTDLPNGDYVITRTWTTPADADEWIAFIQAYNPVSAVIG
jgi:hypothetical protein